MYPAIINANANGYSNLSSIKSSKIFETILQNNHFRNKKFSRLIYCKTRYLHMSKIEVFNFIFLDEEIHFNKRIISEMIHIKKQSYSLNL